MYDYMTFRHTIPDTTHPNCTYMCCLTHFLSVQTRCLTFEVWGRYIKVELNVLQLGFMPLSLVIYNGDLHLSIQPWIFLSSGYKQLLLL